MSRELDFTQLWLTWVESELNVVSKFGIWVKSELSQSRIKKSKGLRWVIESELNHLVCHMSQSRDSPKSWAKRHSSTRSSLGGQGRPLENFSFLNYPLGGRFRTWSSMGGHGGRYGVTKPTAMWPKSNEKMSIGCAKRCICRCETGGHLMRYHHRCGKLEAPFSIKHLLTREAVVWGPCMQWSCRWVTRGD